MSLTLGEEAPKSASDSARARVSQLTAITQAIVLTLRSCLKPAKLN